MSHGLSHSHSQLRAFQINPLSRIPLSSNSLHLHLHFSLFQRCLFQTLAFSFLRLQVLCHPIYRVSLVLDIRLNTLTFMPIRNT